MTAEEVARRYQWQFDMVGYLVLTVAIVCMYITFAVYRYGKKQEAKVQ